MKSWNEGKGGRRGRERFLYKTFVGDDLVSRRGMSNNMNENLGWGRS